HRRNIEAHRRPGADVPDADGGNPAADARGGDLAGQENRDHAKAVPPRAARERLHHESGYGYSHARAQGRIAVRPHDQGFDDRGARESADYRAHATQPADARRAPKAEHRRLLGAALQRAFAQRSDGRRAVAGRPPAEDGDAARGTLAPHAAPAARDQEARTDRRTDGTARAEDRATE